RAEALVEFGAVDEILELDLGEGAALAGLHVLRLDRSPQAALVLDDVARANLVAVDLHRTSWIGESARAGGAAAPGNRAGHYQLLAGVAPENRLGRPGLAIAATVRVPPPGASALRGASPRRACAPRHARNRKGR